MNLCRALAILVALCVCNVFAHAQAPFCKPCGSTGRVPCEEHERELCAAEDDVVFCSAIVNCALCAGVGFVACKDCENAAARDAIEVKKRTVQARKVALENSLDGKFGRPLRKAESRHFVFVMELDRQKVDLKDEKGRPIKREIQNHALVHLYLKRMEELYTDYCARMQINEKEFNEKLRIFVWYLPDDHKRGSSMFCGQSASGGVKLMGSNPSYSVCGNKQNFQDDEKLHRNLVHSATHLLLSAQNPVAWIGNQKAGWIDEGLAHWFEDRYWGICDNYCYQEQNTQVGFKAGKYRLGVRKLIEEDKVPPIGEIFEQNSDTLTPAMQAVAFSYVDYLLSRDGAKFNELCKRLKKKIPSRDALKEVFGLGPLDFENIWRGWVLSTYPKL